MVAWVIQVHDKEVNVSWVNHKLHQVLCLNLEGKALSMVKNLQKHPGTEGIIGWCKLAQDCSSMTAQRLQVLVAKVHQPQRVKSYADVNAAIGEWEMNVQTFLKADGRDDLNEAVKLLSLKQIVPEELSKDIAKASSVLKDYHQVKKYIQEQVAVRRDAKNVSKGPVQLDLNMAAQQVLASLMTGDGQQSADQEQYEY